MRAVLALEFIGENVWAYNRARTRGLTESLAAYERTYLQPGLAHQQRPWVARLTGLDMSGRGFVREFQRGQIDYSQANGTGSRGVWIYYALKPGYYEVYARETWKRARQYFLFVEGTAHAEVMRGEVEMALVMEWKAKGEGMERPLANVRRKGDKIEIRAPYHELLVREIKGIPGRVWHETARMWTLPAASEQQARELVRQFYQIEGEPCYIVYQTVRVTVRGGADANRVYRGGVTVDGRHLFDVNSGYLDMRPNMDFEILDYAGGFTAESTTARGRADKPFHVEYVLRVRVRTDAEWAATGRGEFGGAYELLTGENPVDAFLEEVLARDAGHTTEDEGGAHDE